MVTIRSILFCISLASVSAPVSVASAQEPSPTPYPTREAEQTMAQFSQCLVRTANPQALRRFLRLVPGSRPFQVAGRRLASSYCLPRVPGAVTQLRFQAVLFRSALYAALYRRDFGASDPHDVGSVPLLLLSSEFDGPPDDIPAATRFLRGLGDCAARADAGSVHALLATEVGSRQEQAAISAVLPAVQRCLPENHELRFGRGMLRGMLGEALYKLRAASAPS